MLTHAWIYSATEDFGGNTPDGHDSYVHPTTARDVSVELIEFVEVCSEIDGSIASAVFCVWTAIEEVVCCMCWKLSDIEPGHSLNFR